MQQSEVTDTRDPEEALQALRYLLPGYPYSPEDVVVLVVDTAKRVRALEETLAKHQHNDLARY